MFKAYQKWDEMEQTATNCGTQPSIIYSIPRERGKEGGKRVATDQLWKPDPFETHN